MLEKIKDFLKRTLSAPVFERKIWVEPRLDLAGFAPGLISFDGVQIAADSGKNLDGPLVRRENQKLKVAEPPPGVVPANRAMALDQAGIAADQVMAMDAAVGGIYNWTGNFVGDGVAWPGFSVLADLAQRPEFRNVIDTYADEMTRKWIELESSSDEDLEDVIRGINEDLTKFKVRESFRKMAEQNGVFGRGHLYIKFSDSDDTTNSLPLVISDKTIRKGSLQAIKPVEAFWVYPAYYNTQDPADPYFYRPSQWWMQGKTYHADRLLTFVSYELPDILKPAYAFAGVSLVQQILPDVRNWLRTRQSVSDMIRSFSIVALATNMAARTAPGAASGPPGQASSAQFSAQSLLSRIAGFNQMRDNRGTFVYDKNSEDIKNVAAPLSGLDELQAQAQEHVASASKIPLVKYTGITPSGLNASSDGEIRVWYDNINAKQENDWRDHLSKILQIIQLNRFGKIYPEISFKFVSLWQLDEAGEAAVKKISADVDIELLNAGAVSPIEIRKKLAKDPKSGFSGIDPDDLPEPHEGSPGEIDEGETSAIARGGLSGSESGANSGV